MSHIHNLKRSLISLLPLALAMLSLISWGAVSVYADCPCSVPGFSAATNYGAGVHPYHIAAADFNVDGKSDLAVVNFGPGGNVPGSVTILLGNGTGGFSPSNGSPFTTGRAGSNSVAVGDLNGDSKLDLAVSNLAGRVSILFGDGTGGFLAAQSPNDSFDTLGTAPTFVMIADIDGARGLDLAVTNQGSGASGTVSIMLNNGLGGFPVGNVRTFDVGGRPQSLVVSDFNGDSQPDVAVANQNSDSVSILLNTGVFTNNGWSRTDLSVNAAPRFVTTGHFNGDTNIDLAVAGTTALILLGNGGGGFSPTPTVDIGVNSAYYLGVDDFNSDGESDLVVTRVDNQSVSLALGNGMSSTTSSGFTFWDNFKVGGRNPYSIAVSDFNGDGKPDIATSNFGNSAINDNGNVAVRLNACNPVVRRSDYDGDEKTDIAVWRPSTGAWYISKSSDGGVQSPYFGSTGDLPVPGDYDGDEKTDVAVFRPSNGTWYILKSSTGAFIGQQWGLSGDKPAPGDYDGDAKTDFAVFRPSNGTWYILKSSTGTFISQEWGASGDIPVQGDYDRDGKTDVAVWRPSNGVWYILQSCDSSILDQQWGLSGDTAVPGDYDGDGKTDIAVWRPSDGYWRILRSSDGAQQTTQWGTSGDVPQPGDYDGDGRTDTAIWRPSTSIWYVLKTSDGTVLGYEWGLSGDVPVASAYIIE